MKPNFSLKDIRFRDWINYNTDISKALKLLIELCILNELEFNDEFIENKLKIKYQRRPVPL